MSEPNKASSEEVRPARIKFLYEVFLRWRRRFCVDIGRSERENEIIWRRDVSGNEFGPAQVAEVYFRRYKPAMGKFMVDPRHNLDRHKIVALTQKVFMEELPITVASYPKIDLSSPPREIYGLNCAFAYYFAPQFLCRWHEDQWPKKFNKPFPSETFCELLLYRTDEGLRFTREHRKYLMSELHCKFPAFLIAQLWFALEQRGLAQLENVAREIG